MHPKLEDAAVSASQATDPELTALADIGRPYPLVVPLVALVAAGGVLFIERGFELARANGQLGQARGYLWIGIAAIVVPVALALVARSPTRTQRLSVLVVAAVSLYAVKVLYAPDRVLFPDEILHFANAQRILEHHRLFIKNEILPASSNYPGVAALAAELSSITGLSLFTVAIVLIGTARVMLVLALFVLFERLAGESRSAGIGAFLFAASPNFMYWGSQFAYESLAFPLFVVALLCGVNAGTGEHRRGWAFMAALVATGIVVTHHLTGYALAVVLWAMIVVARRRAQSTSVPLALALYVTAIALTWGVLVATGTDSYLGSIFGRAFHSIADAVSNKGATHTPFQAAGFKTPLDDKVLAVLSAGLAILLSIVAVRRSRASITSQPLGAMLRIAAMLAFVAFVLRIFPDAWEPANRAASYVFLGVAFVGGTYLADVRAQSRRGWDLAVASMAAMAFVLVAGASVIGWPAAAQLPRADRVKVGNAVVPSQSVAAADWLAANAPRTATVIADDNVGRLLLLEGFDKVVAGRNPPAPLFLRESGLSVFAKDYLVQHRVRYVVLDRRRISGDNLIGRFFARPSGDAQAGTYPPRTRSKFSGVPSAERVYDSGDVVIYRFAPAAGGHG